MENMIVAIIYLISLVIFIRYIDKTLKEMGNGGNK
jgi:hypothetical protein